LFQNNEKLVEISLEITRCYWVVDRIEIDKFKRYQKTKIYSI